MLIPSAQERCEAHVVQRGPLSVRFAFVKAVPLTFRGPCRPLFVKAVSAQAGGRLGAGPVETQRTRETRYEGGGETSRGGSETDTGDRVGGCWAPPSGCVRRCSRLGESWCRVNTWECNQQRLIWRVDPSKSKEGGGGAGGLDVARAQWHVSNSWAVGEVRFSGGGGGGIDRAPKKLGGGGSGKGLK